ncbi:MAG: ComEC/Rec2 family competence protein [Myxococcota bacterium]
MTRASTILMGLSVLCLAACFVDTTLPDLSVQTGAGQTDAGYCTTDELLEFPAETLQMHVIDVGQGDAIWIRTPYFEEPEFESRDVLIDVGPSGLNDSSPGGETVVDYMIRMGRRLDDPIDAVVISHAHADHYGGLPAVAAAFRIERYYDPSYIPSSSSLWSTREDARQATEDTWNATLSMSSGSTLADDLFQPTEVFGNYVDAQLLWAADSLAGLPASSNENDTSLVFSIRWSDRRILLMGDAEEHVEEELVRAAQAGEVDLTASVLKVGHHGSSTSSTVDFLNAALGNADESTWAVISSGRKSFGGEQLPSQQTITALKTRLNEYRLLSTENGDDGRSEGEEHDDDHVLVTIGPNGEVRACYVP